MDITEVLRLLHKKNGGKDPLAKEAEQAEQAEHDAVFEKLDAVPHVNGAKKRKSSNLARSSNLTRTSSQLAKPSPKS